MRKYDVLIEKNVTIKNPHNIVFGYKTTVQSGTYLYGSKSGKLMEIGNEVVISGNCTFFGEGGIKIGDFCHFGPSVIVTSQYVDPHKNKDKGEKIIKTAPIYIGKGCLIGSGSIIMPGTYLDDYTVVAANSVVFGRWEKNITLMGSPAKKSFL